MYKRYYAIPLILAAFWLAACTLPAQAIPTIDATALAYTVSSTQTALAAANTVTAIADQPTVTKAPAVTPTQPPTATPTLSPTPTHTPTPTVSPTPVTENCTNRAEFISETIPDGSRFSTNQALTKTWTLRNVGTCTWTTAYSLAFVNGEAMGAAESIPLTQTVPADGTVVLSVNLTSPQTAGQYQGDWKLRSVGGAVFGVGKQADETFWVQIIVAESVSDLKLGDPVSVERFDSDTHAWLLTEDDNLRYELKDGSLVMTARQPIGDQWRVNALVEVSDLYLQANFKTGESCNGKDSYGLIIRTSAKENNVYDNGYVFTVSCDGMYRLYRLKAGVYSGLVGWTASPDLLSGPNQSNQVGIWATGDQIRLYVNGKKVAELTDSDLAQGQYGLVVRAETDEDFQVAVDDLSYWELK